MVINNSNTTLATFCHWIIIQDETDVKFRVFSLIVTPPLERWNQYLKKLIAARSM